MKKTAYLLILLLCFACSGTTTKSTIEIEQTGVNSALVTFSTEHIKRSINTIANKNVVYQITFMYDTANLTEQEYTIQVESNNELFISGGDEVGLMYGGLELAEYIKLNKKLPNENISGSPFIIKRGLKFNIPLDARTPSYDDSGDAAQNNIIEMWNMDFWTEFLDQMAIHRYNTLTLWNPHPFPSMVKLEEYPDIALNDVYQTTLVPTGYENEWGDPQLVADTVIDNLRKIKEISIDEKIEFWQNVMQYAADRGIDIYFITWNICPNSVALPVKSKYRTYGNHNPNEQPGKYGITHQIDNPTTIKYMRAATRKFILTYPLLKGIGVTAGEHMPKDWSVNREEWLWNAYGKGILDAKKEQPKRKVDFIHRVWYSDLNEIMKYWGAYPDTFELSFKYAKARLYSSPYIPFDDEQIDQMKPHGLKCWWNLRNDDMFVYRWGDPDYVRNFINNFDLEYTAGYHMGSDGYVWGREFSSIQFEGKKRELEISKHWYNFMMWGRLGYNPNLNEEFFIQKIQERLPECNAPLMYKTWQTVSKILPEVNKFHWRNWDHMFSFETCLSAKDGFRTVLDFVDNPTMAGQNIQNAQDYAQMILQDDSTMLKTPAMVISDLNSYANQTISNLEKLKRKDLPLEEEYMLADFEAMSWLGKYYALKIESAVQLAFFQETSDVKYKDEALKLMQASLHSWKKYGATSKKFYKPQMLARPGILDWDVLQMEVEKDIELIKKL